MPNLGDYVLDQARRNPDDVELGERALKYNQLLWSIIQIDVTEEDNALPEVLNANLMSLSISVDKQTSKSLNDANEELYDSLIDLNISEGLMEDA